MKIFIIHSSCDKNQVEKIKEEINNNAGKQNICILSNGGKLWKLDAAKLIREAQLILFVVGKTSASSKNIGWEIKKAIKSNKCIIYYQLNSQNDLHQALFVKDFFTKKTTLSSFASKADSVDDVVKRINDYEQGEYNIFNNNIEDKELLLEQYKLFLQTSETLVERRQSVNNFYITVNSAILSIASVAIALFDLSLIKIWIGLISSIVGLVFVGSWRRILDAYGILNASKMKIISLIERKLPISLYDSEWTVMCDKLNSRKYISFTDGEKRIPKLFSFIYGISLLFCIFMLIKHYLP